jgi:hypothetical protein
MNDLESKHIEIIGGASPWVGGLLFFKFQVTIYLSLRSPLPELSLVHN